jgi:hypothetical protein
VIRSVRIVAAMALALALGAPPAALAATPGAHSASHISNGAIIAAVAGGLVALACVAWALARTFAYEPRWTLSLRHAVAEASYRASSTWEEFGDWVRSER